MTLDIDMIAGAALRLASEEVVEANLVERRRRRVRGQVAADAVGRHVGTHDHRHRVPANVRTDAALDDEYGEPLHRLKGCR